MKAEMELEMNTNFENIATAFLTSAGDNLNDAIVLMKAKAPELMEQILSWYFAQAIVFNLFILMGFIATGFLLRYCHNNNRWNSGPAPDSILTALMAIVSLIIGIPFFIDNTLTLIKIKVAPMLFMAEYFKNLIGS